jgi:uncharacterized membrane-anchored protein YhcB (DUF1043 family)
MLAFTQDQWIIIGLIFVLGLLIGMFLTAGGRRKWKSRYDLEHKRVADLERTHKEREAHWADREKEWRERDSVRGSSVRDERHSDDRRPL